MYIYIYTYIYIYIHSCIYIYNTHRERDTQINKHNSNIGYQIILCIYSKCHITTCQSIHPLGKIVETNMKCWFFKDSQSYFSENTSCLIHFDTNRHLLAHQTWFVVEHCEFGSCINKFLRHVT